MTHEDHKKQAFDPENYPALQEFLPAYLHEDFEVEYGSAPKAIEALVADASGDQIRNVKDEWQALRKALAGGPWEVTQRSLGELGTAWRPESEQELQAIDEILSRAEA
jgi:CdiI immunity protein